MKNEDEGVVVLWEEMLGVCRYLDLPATERVRKAEAVLDSVVPPVWLDDFVLEGCYRSGLIERTPRVGKGQNGDMISSDGKGNVTTVVLTQKGRDFLKEHANDIILKG